MENENKDLSKEYWSAESEKFSEKCMAEYNSPLGSTLGSFLKSLLPGKKGDGLRALDVGCGTGFLSFLLGDLGCDVTGVDFAPGMIKEAEKNCKNEGFDNITFMNMDAQNLDFPDCSFDFAVVRNVVWMVPDAGRVYAEMLRVLKEGGVLLNIDGDYGKGIRSLEESDDFLKLPKENQKEVRVRGEIARTLPVSFEERPVWDVGVLWKAGASQVRVIRDIEDYLDIAKYTKSSMHEEAIRQRSQIFAVIAVK